MTHSTHVLLVINRLPHLVVLFSGAGHGVEVGDHLGRNGKGGSRDGAGGGKGPRGGVVGE